jgi:hypothetical protein
VASSQRFAAAAKPPTSVPFDTGPEEQSTRALAKKASFPSNQPLEASRVKPNLRAFSCRPASSSPGVDRSRPDGLLSDPSRSRAGARWGGRSCSPAFPLGGRNWLQPNGARQRNFGRRGVVFDRNARRLVEPSGLAVQRNSRIVLVGTTVRARAGAGQAQESIPRRSDSGGHRTPRPLRLDARRRLDVHLSLPRRRGSVGRVPPQPRCRSRGVRGPAPATEPPASASTPSTSCARSTPRSG